MKKKEYGMYICIDTVCIKYTHILMNTIVVFSEEITITIHHILHIKFYLTHAASAFLTVKQYLTAIQCYSDRN